jgi:hypothetical protein
MILTSACSSRPAARHVHHARHPASVASRVYRWDQGPGGKARKALTVRAAALARSAKTERLAASRTACARIGAAAAAGQRAAVIPDASAQRWWALALRDLRLAAAACPAVTSRRVLLTGAAGADLRAADDGLARLADVIRKLGR